MRLIKLLLPFLLIPQIAFATFTSVGTLGTNQEKTSDNSLTLTTSATLEANNLAILIIAYDNYYTSSTNSSIVNSITDTAGNTWTRLRDWSASSGAAADGAAVSIWINEATVQLGSGSTITITFAQNITAKAVTAWEFSTDASKITVYDSDNIWGNSIFGDDPGNKSLTVNFTGEHIWIRAIASETEDAGMSVSGTWTGFTKQQTSGGVDNTNIAVKAEFKIETGATSSNTNPSIGSYDHADQMVGVHEETVGGAGAGIDYNIQGFFGL